MHSCEGCTACCSVLKIDALDKPQYTPCIHCEGGCTIYDTKPKTCSEFECAYLQGKNIPLSLRPDNCGIIFMKKTDRIFSGLLIPGMEVSDIAKGQIDSFNRQGYSVVLIDQRVSKPHIMLAEGHDGETIYNEYKEYLSGYLFD